MGGNLLRRQRNFLGATGFGQDKAVALMERKPTPKVGQSKRTLAVAAVGGSNEVKKYLVLRDRQKLPLAKHPPGRREIASKYPDFTNIRLCHRWPPKSAKERCLAAQCKN